MTFSYLADSNLTTRLLEALTPEQGRLLRSVAEEAARQRLPLYIVGGYVRDLLLGHPGLDFDLVVEGDAIGLARAVAAKHGGKVTVHTRFKTAQWFPSPATDHPEFVDFISTRSESYKHPAALPTVKPGMLADDLQRRDFTINTLALRLDGEHFGELRDDLGGLEDLQAGLIRVLHHGSFADDPTRLFRAVRYEQRYGFRITPETLALIPDACLLIKVLSAERVRHELDLVLEEEKAASMLERLAEFGSLAAVHPALEWKRATQKRFVNGMAAAQTLEHPPSCRTLGWTLWLMDVPLPGLESIEKRLHFESGLRALLLAASALFAEVNSLAGKKPSQCVAVLDEIPLKAVQAVFLALPAGPVRQGLCDYLETWRHVRPRTTGHDLKKRSLPPGPAYQSILRRLRAAWLDGEVKTVDEEMALLDKLIKKYRSE
jgi:tRNA nucleotidyltransferase (CCA-adding enzyme)